LVRLEPISELARLLDEKGVVARRVDEVVEAFVGIVIGVGITA
jgi:hypothetical protein